MAVGEDVEDIEDILLEPSQPRGPMPALSVGRRMVKMQAEDVGAAAAAAYISQANNSSSSSMGLGGHGQHIRVRVRSHTGGFQHAARHRPGIGHSGPRAELHVCGPVGACRCSTTNDAAVLQLKTYT